MRRSGIAPSPERQCNKASEDHDREAEHDTHNTIKAAVNPDIVKDPRPQVNTVSLKDPLPNFIQKQLPDHLLAFPPEDPEIAILVPMDHELLLAQKAPLHKKDRRLQVL